MGFRLCENCTEDRAVTGSDLCDICEDVFDDNALLADMTHQRYAEELGVRILPR